MRALLAALILLSSGAEASRAAKKKAARDPHTTGLGRSCKETSACNGHGQKCLKEVDANGKPKDAGLCVLPCASFEAGTTKVVPGAPVDVSKKGMSKKPPPRCPAKYQCRTAGAGVPIDICVKE